MLTAQFLLKRPGAVRVHPGLAFILQVVLMAALWAIVVRFVQGYRPKPSPRPVAFILTLLPTGAARAAQVFLLSPTCPASAILRGPTAAPRWQGVVRFRPSPRPLATGRRFLIGPGIFMTPWFCFPHQFGESPGAAQIAHTGAALAFAEEIVGPFDDPGPCASRALSHILRDGIEATASSASVMCPRVEPQAALLRAESRDLLRACPGSARAALGAASDHGFCPALFRWAARLAGAPDAAGVL